MATNNTQNSAYLIRQQVYKDMLLEAIMPMLLNDNFIFDASGGFSDGNTLNIPISGMPSVYQRTEDEDTKLQNVSIGNFTLAITQFPEAAQGITRKLVEDGYATEYLIGQLIPMQANAIGQVYETQILSVQNQQTASNPNLINGAPHRFVASGTNNVLTTADFLKAAVALDTANIPSDGRIAIIDPRSMQALALEIGGSNIQFNRDFMGIPAENLRKDLMATADIYGFKVFVSNFTAFVASETINPGSGAKTATNAQACLFFSIAKETYKPIARAWRRTPEAQAYLIQDRDNLEVYRFNARFGTGLMRPQNLVVILAQPPAF